MDFSTGYAFLLYLEEQSVQKLIDACFQQDDKLYLCVSSPTIKDKPVSHFSLLYSRNELDTPSGRMAAHLYLFRWTEANAI